MSGQRVIFTSFASASSSKLRPWREHRNRVLGEFVDETVDPDGAAVVWHLVSANNRELARSAAVFDRFQAAEESARRAIVSAVATSVTLVSDDRRGLFGWYLSLEEVPVALCARWYLAERERRHALQLATAGLPHATLGVGARQLVEQRPRSVRHDD